MYEPLLRGTTLTRAARRTDRAVTIGPNPAAILTVEPACTKFVAVWPEGARPDARSTSRKIGRAFDRLYS